MAGYIPHDDTQTDSSVVHVTGFLSFASSGGEEGAATAVFDFLVFFAVVAVGNAAVCVTRNGDEGCKPEELFCSPGTVRYGAVRWEMGETQGVGKGTHNEEAVDSHDPVRMCNHLCPLESRGLR